MVFEISSNLCTSSSLPKKKGRKNISAYRQRNSLHFIQNAEKYSREASFSSEWWLSSLPLCIAGSDGHTICQFVCYLWSSLSKPPHQLPRNHRVHLNTLLKKNLKTPFKTALKLPRLVRRKVFFVLLFEISAYLSSIASEYLNRA